MDEKWGPLRSTLPRAASRSDTAVGIVCSRGNDNSTTVSSLHSDQVRGVAVQPRGPLHTQTALLGTEVLFVLPSHRSHWHTVVAALQRRLHTCAVAGAQVHQAALNQQRQSLACRARAVTVRSTRMPCEFPPFVE